MASTHTTDAAPFVGSRGLLGDIGLTPGNALAKEYADPVIDAFYEHLLSFDETAAFFREPAVLERVKRLQKEYFLRLTAGDYEEEYVENRLSIGAVHERIGLPVESY